MMARSAKFAPPNSIVAVIDPSGGEIPDWDAGSRIWSTESCIIVSCLNDTDGETEFTLGISSEVDPGHHPAFEGNIKTPSRKIGIVTVLIQTILEIEVPEQLTA